MASRPFRTRGEITHGEGRPSRLPQGQRWRVEGGRGRLRGVLVVRLFTCPHTRVAVCSYTVDVAGAWLLNAVDEKSGRHVAHSPWPLYVAAGATHPPSSEMVGDDMVLAAAGAEVSFVFLSRDRRSNRQLYGGEAWQASVTGPMPHPQPLPVKLVDHGDGSYGCSYVVGAAADSTHHTSSLRLGQHSRPVSLSWL